MWQGADCNNQSQYLKYDTWQVTDRNSQSLHSKYDTWHVTDRNNQSQHSKYATWQYVIIAKNNHIIQNSSYCKRWRIVQSITTLKVSHKIKMNLNPEKNCSFIHLLIHPFTRSFTNSFIHFLIHSFIHSFFQLLIHSWIHPFFVHALIHKMHRFLNQRKCRITKGEIWQSDYWHYKEYRLVISTVRRKVGPTVY